VIGAGLAGLAAAFQLRKKKWDVIVVDARDRIGGRVFTYRFREAPNLYCELGGEWVGKQHHNIHRLCRHFRLDLIPHLFDCSFAEQGKIIQTFPAGVLPFSAQSKAAFREVKREFEKKCREHAVARGFRQRRLVDHSRVQGFYPSRPPSPGLDG
jgi:monoamine oxidase